MRVAALNDVHGNAPALRAVLAELGVDPVDAIVFGGDLAGGPLPKETIELARALPNARFVMGNADRELIGAATSPLIDAWARGQLEERDRDFLRSFEPTVSLDGVLYCHATPHSDEQIFTRVTPDERVLELLEPVGERVVVCGHTHVQFDRQVGELRVVNAGSVGMPYGTTDACWALVADGRAELRRTPYDLQAAAASLRQSGHALRDQLIAENVLASPDDVEATAFFEAQVG